MRDPAQMQQTVTSILVSTLSVEAPSADADLFEGGVMDSLALVQVLVALQQELGTEIDLGNLDFENFRTIARIAEFASKGAA